jgi:hypothetical protein
MKTTIIMLFCLATSISYSQQLYRQTFSSGVTTTQYGISMPGEAFNNVYNTPNYMIAESILYMLSAEETLSVNNITNYEIALYPNPMTDRLYVKTNNVFNSEIKIYDNGGKQILSETILNDGIDISKLSPGMYHVVIFKNQSIIKNQKIIKK